MNTFNITNTVNVIKMAFGIHCKSHTNDVL